MREVDFQGECVLNEIVFSSTCIFNLSKEKLYLCEHYKIGIQVCVVGERGFSVVEV